MKDIIFIKGRLTEQEEEKFISSQVDKLMASGTSCDVLDPSKIRIGLLNYYRGFIFVNVGLSDRVRRFVNKGKKLNKTFFHFNDVFMNGKEKNVASLAKYVDCEITLSNKKDDESKNGCIKTRTTYSEMYLSKFNNPSELEKRKNCVLFLDKKSINKRVVSYIQDFMEMVPGGKIFWFGGDRLSKLFLKNLGKIDILPAEVNDTTISACKSAMFALVDSSLDKEKKDPVTDMLTFTLVPIIDSKDLLEDDHIRNIVLDALNGKVGELQRSLNALRHEALHSKASVYNATGFRSAIFRELKPFVGFNIPGTVIRGGIHVAVKHASLLKQHGYDLVLISNCLRDNEQNIMFEGHELPVVAEDSSNIDVHFDKLVATLWNTVPFVESYTKATNKYYLVQGYETDFSEHGDIYKIGANKTYFSAKLQYITISKWCEEWLKKDYGVEKVKYAPNGINTKQFEYTERLEPEGRKFKVLIEGNSLEPFRGVDEAFTIINQIDRSQIEVHYLSYVESLKPWYNPDYTHFAVPYEQVSKIYASCDLLLKCSTLESFSYPPIEMMATGGVCVIASNEGNSVYARHRVNAMVYKQGDIDTAKRYVKELLSNKELRDKLSKGGVATAEKYSWEKIQSKIINLYS